MDKQLQEALAGDLMIGAGRIAEFIYGDAARARDVYRNPAGLSFFKHGASIAAFKSTIRKELEEAQRRLARTANALRNRHQLTHGGALNRPLRDLRRRDLGP